MAKLLPQRTPFAPILGAVLIALVLLATVQYYWVGEVSRGERERMQASLQTGMARFSEDFDHELARIYLSFQMDASTLRDKAWDRYTERYHHWSATAPYPGLVKDVFLVEVFESRSPRLSQFDLTERRFKPSNWPPDFDALYARLQRIHQTTSAEATLAPVEESLPALVIPLSSVWLLSDDQQQLGLDADLVYSGDDILAPARRQCQQCKPRPPTAPLFAYTIVTLDRAYLTEVFIPALAQRYFGHGNDLDYHLAVVSRSDPQTLIYRSDPQFTIDDLASSDGTINILSVRSDEFNQLLLDDAFRLRDLSDDQQRQQERVFISILGRSSSDDHDGHWQLILKHRVGSLEAAVLNLRMRNLLISFSTLLMLAATVALIVVSARRAQRLARQQIDFVAAVSHELRTPLAIIRSAGENLADGVVHDLQQARQYGTVICGEGRRLTEMVEQVLHFASTQSGRQIYTIRPVDVHSVLDHALLMCRQLDGSRNLTLEVSIEPDLPLVLADPVALQRAVQNLLNNAVKYGGAGGWIGVYARASATGCEVQITVQDHGIGIDPADLPHIFEPFYRGRDVVATQIHGSGLGLSLVKNIVEALGGRLHVESAPGRGSAFTLHLRCVEIGQQPSLSDTAGPLANSETRI